MWKFNRKTEETQEKTIPVGGVELKDALPPVTFACLGGFEAALSALLIKATRPEASVAVIFKPCAADLILPVRFSAVDLTQFDLKTQALDLNMAQGLIAKLLSSAAIKTETFLIVEDLKHAFDARQTAFATKAYRYFDSLETLHALPKLLDRSNSPLLEGSLRAQGGKIILAGEVWSALKLALSEYDIPLCLPRSISFEESSICFDAGGNLPFEKLVRLDAGAEDGASSVPIIGLEHDGLEGAAAIFDRFHLFSYRKGELLVFGEKGTSLESLSEALVSRLPNLSEANMVRQAYLPARVQTSAEQELALQRKNFPFSQRFTQMGLMPFGAAACAGAQSALSGMLKISQESDLREAAQWFNGRA